MKNGKTFLYPSGAMYTNIKKKKLTIVSLSLTWFVNANTVCRSLYV